MSRKSKSFTLIEVVVVIGVMGLVMGGLLSSMRQVIEGETLLKKMLEVEEETRFIMDTFAQDSEYSELFDEYKPDKENPGDIFSYVLQFNVAEKKSELGGEGSLDSKYTYGQGGDGYYIRRELTRDDNTVTSTLNNTPLKSRPVYRVRLIETPDGSLNYFITFSIVYRVILKDQEILIPVETSAMSRTFEF